MNAFLPALVIWSLPFFGASCGSTTIQSPSAAESQPTPTPTQETVKLTSENPSDAFSIKSDLLKDPPEILEVTVTKVVNPAASAVNIFVYVSPRSDKSQAERVEVGNFSLYPADRPGKFMLSPAAALRRFSETRKSSIGDAVQLVFEMQLPDQKKTNVEVTIASPNWQSKKN